MTNFENYATSAEAVADSYLKLAANFLVAL